MARSQILDLDGPVHYIDHGGRGSPMVLVHGLGGSHVNWLAVAPGLARRHHVYAVDLAGFGLTPLMGRSASMHASRRLLDGFIEQVSPDEPVTLVGNSMGGLITMLEAAEAPEKVAAAIERELSPAGINITQANGPAAGQSVFHYHTHILPRRVDDNASMNWGLQPGDMDQIERLAERIRAAIRE